MSASSSDSSATAAQLLTRYQADLRRYVAAMVGADRAEDVIQDAFLRLSRALEQTRINNPRAFLYRICANLATDELRRRRRRREYEAVMAAVPEELAPAAADMADLQEQLEQVQAAVAALPTKCRRVFMLRKFKDMSYSEIALLEGISVKTVENQVSRALKLIRQQIKRQTQ